MLRYLTQLIKTMHFAESPKQWEARYFSVSVHNSYSLYIARDVCSTSVDHCWRKGVQ